MFSPWTSLCARFVLKRKAFFVSDRLTSLPVRPAEISVARIPLQKSAPAISSIIDSKTDVACRLASMAAEV